jgi:hypothetical protein
MTTFSVGQRLSGVVVTIYATTTNSDLTEGRGRQVDHSYHLTMRDWRS